MTRRQHPFLSALLILLVLASVAATPASAGTNPSDLLAELAKAVRGEPTDTALWKSHLDTDFSSWRIGGSQNLPVIAAAIALFEEPLGTDADGNPYDIFTWWETFFACQNGTGCPLADPGRLRFMKGSEVLSNTYDAAVTTSVAAVNYYRFTIGFHAELTEARLYLRKTWSLYALAAGSGPASSLIDRRGDAGGPETKTCHLNARGQFYYTGPFMALAGARSTSAHYCQDDRGPLFARAIDFSLSKNLRETVGQADVLDYIETHFAGNSYGENVYALDPASRQLVRDHLTQGDEASTFVGVLNNGATRFVRTMRLLAWPGVRVSVLEGNPNRNTAAVYGAKYTASSQQAEMLYPWNEEAARNGITEGYGRLLPGVLSPTTVEASNLADGESPNGIHGTRVVSMGIPTSTPQYHVVIGDFAAFEQ